MIVKHPLHEFTFDGLDLTGRTVYEGGYSFEVLSNGSSFGSAQALTSEEVSGLIDGALARLDAWGNRTPEFLVRVRGGNSGVIARGERELTRRAGDQPKVLSFTPPDGWGARTDYDVLVTAPEFQWNDLAELALGTMGRIWRLTLTCSPFGLAAEATTAQATFAVPAPGTAAEVVISDGTSATGWSSPAGAVTVASGRLQVPGVVTSDFATNYNHLQGRWCEYETTRSGLSQSLATMKFVYADVDRGSGYFPVNRNSLPVLLVNGSGNYRPMSIVYTGSGGIYRCVWYVSDVLTATSLTFRTRLADAVTEADPAPAWRIDNVKVTNVPPASTSEKYSEGTLTGHGSAPGSGVIQMTGGGSILYTCPAEVQSRYGYRPGSLASNQPMSSFPPGTYIAIAPGATSGTMTITQAGATSVVLTATSANPGVLGSVTLPLLDVPENTTATLGASRTGDVNTRYLFWMGEGAALTYVRGGSGTGYISLVHPQIGDTTPGVFVGDNADMSDGVFPAATLASWDQHRVDPAGTYFFTDVGAVTFTGRAAFHGFAAEEE